MKLLCIEDDLADAELLSHRLLAAWPQAEITWVDSQPKLRTALAHRPDVILSDSNVPGLPGLAALAIAQEFAPGIPFIFFCGDQRDSFHDCAFKSGAAAFVNKNQPEPLISEIVRVVRPARAEG